MEALLSKFSLSKTTSPTQHRRHCHTITVIIIFFVVVVIVFVVVFVVVVIVFVVVFAVVIITVIITVIIIIFVVVVTSLNYKMTNTNNSDNASGGFSPRDTTVEFEGAAREIALILGLPVRAAPSQTVQGQVQEASQEEVTNRYNFNVTSDDFSPGGTTADLERTPREVRQRLEAAPDAPRYMNASNTSGMIASALSPQVPREPHVGVLAMSIQALAAAKARKALEGRAQEAPQEEVTNRYNFNVTSDDFSPGGTTADLERTPREVRQRLEAAPDAPRYISSNTSGMLASSLSPQAPIQPHVGLLAMSIQALAAAEAQEALEGRAQEAPKAPGSGRPEKSRPEKSRPRRANYAGVQKSRRQETSSPARNVGTRGTRRQQDREDARKWREQQAARANNATRAQEKAAKELTCGNCLKHGHRVRDCAQPQRDGFVHGCPVCNQSDHESAEGCKMTWPQRLEKKLMWAIEHRAHRPPLAAYANWYELFLEAKGQEGIVLPQVFPWTASFARHLMLETVPVWETFDYAVNDWRKLPVDCLTASQDAVLRNESVLRDDRANL